MPINFNNSVYNFKDTPGIYSAPSIYRPAPGVNGRIFIDTTTGQIEQDNGASWVNIGGVTASGGIFTGQIVVLRSSFGSGTCIATNGQIELGDVYVGHTDNNNDNLRFGTSNGPDLRFDLGAAYNTFLGDFIAYEFVTNKDISFNTFVGYRIFRAINHGSGNTAVGTEIGQNIAPTTANNLTLIGSNIDTDFDNLNNSTGLGHGASVSASNQMVFGDGNISHNEFSGAFDITSTETTVNGNISGSLIIAMPFQGYSYKKLIVYYDLWHASANYTYTFPTAFRFTPSFVLSNGFANGIVSLSTTQVIFNFTVLNPVGYASPGFILIEGF